MKSQRIKWIDILKGIGIVCIVFSHVLQDKGSISKILYAFHVPLFFFVTGLVYRDDESLLHTLVKKLNRIMLPYFIWGIISLILFLALGQFAEKILDSGRQDTLATGIYELIRGYSNGNSPLWFLPAMFLTSILMWSCVRIMSMIEKKNNTKIVQLLPAVCSIILAYIITENEITYAVWSVDDVIILFFFTWLGYLLKCDIWCLPSVATGCILLGLGSGFALLANGRISYLVGRYNNLLAFYGIASLIIVGLAAIARGIQRSVVLEYIGRNTMPILLMHKFPILFFQCVCPFIKDRWADRAMPFLVLITTLAIVSSCGVGEILRRTIPFSLGEARRKGS